MSIHYKFTSNLDYDTLTFDGLHISVGDLKKSIIHQKKLGKSADFDLKITNAQTKEVYTEDDTLIPRNTSVMVARVPLSGNVRKPWERNESMSHLHRMNEDSQDGGSHNRLAKVFVLH